MTKMTMDRSWRAALAVLLVAPLTLAGCSDSAEAGDSRSDPDAVYARVINVEAMTVQPGSFQEVIRLTGTVQANRDVQVSAEETGVVKQTFVDKGASVRAGQAILKIDDGILASQVAQARAQAQLAQETWQRRQRLYEEDRVGSELAYLEAKYTAEQAAANLATLEQRLSRTVVRAPIEGILDHRFVEVGTMVNPGTPVARIVDLDPVKITAGVPERYAADVEPGSGATVSIDALGGQVFDGTISYVGSAVNPQNRTFPVEFALPNPGRAVKPEMVAEVGVTRRTLDNAVVVPQEALVRVADGYVVFVVEKEDDQSVARARAVTLGPSQRNQVVVTAGLEVGARLIVVGHKQVADGDHVRVVGER